MRHHPYATDGALSGIFNRSPLHASAAVSLTDEGGELRERMIAERVLVPASDVARDGRSSTNGQATVRVDLASAFSAAREIIGSSSIAEARAIADHAETDSQLRVALRSILALPPATREQMVARSRR